MAITIRIPDLLRSKINAYIEKRKVEYSRYCLNDFFAEAARNLVDGPAVLRPEPGYQFQTQRDEPQPITGRKKTAAELAASIPGLSLGVGAVVSPLFADAPGEDVPSWRPELDKVRQIWQSDPSAGAEEYATLMLGGKMPPGQFKQWHSDQKVFNGLVNWLDEHRAIEDEQI